METVYGYHAPKKTCVYKWIGRYKEGREAVEDEEGRGRPTTSRNDENVGSVRSLVEEDGRLTVDEIAQTTKEILREFRWEFLPHPPYSPDLAPSDFFLFPKLKEHLKRVRFNTTDEAKHAARTWL